MGADYDHLRAFILASTKMHIGNQYAISTLRTQVQLLEQRLQAISPTLDPVTAEAINEVRKNVEDAFSGLDDRTDALISALEVYVNG
jgi:hypothetical protein